MKTVIAIVLSLVASLVFCRPLVAAECYTDLDCEIDQRCSKAASDTNGICVKAGTSGKGSYSPSFSPSPAPSPSQSPSRRGKFCMSNTDCDPGQSCSKKGNDLYGACY